MKKYGGNLYLMSEINACMQYFLQQLLDTSIVFPLCVVHSTHVPDFVAGGGNSMNHHAVDCILICRHFRRSALGVAAAAAAATTHTATAAPTTNDQGLR